MKLLEKIPKWLTSFTVPKKLKVHPHNNLWQDMLKSLDLTLHLAIRNPAFIFCFAGVIVLAGSIGIWLPYIFCMSKELLRPEALLTYGLSILASILAETLLTKQDRNLGVVMLGYMLGLISVCCLLIGYFETFDVGNKNISLIGIFFVLLLWFFAKGTDNIYDPNPIYDKAPIGGGISETTDANLQGSGIDDIDSTRQDTSVTQAITDNKKGLNDEVFQGQGVQ